MTRYESFISKEWETAGIAQVMVIRTRADGLADLAVFLADVLCLGVKDAWLADSLAPDELADYLKEQVPEDRRERLHPACAKKLIEGAVAYAEGFGFAPHREYRKARKVLAGIDAAGCPREFVFGSDGKPCYVRGPDDDEARVDRILGILEARCGPDGYFYDDPMADSDDAAADRSELMELLDGQAIGSPRFYEVSGLIMGMLVAPTPILPTRLLPLLWPAESDRPPTADTVARTTELLMAYWEIQGGMRECAIDPIAHPDEEILDVLEEDFAGDQTGGLAMSAATMDWAKGFLRATKEWPDAWGNARERADLAPHWEVLGWWAEFQVAANRDAIVRHAESDPPRTLNASVKALARALRRPLPPTA
jgi:hypothetical protein